MSELFNIASVTKDDLLILLVMLFSFAVFFVGLRVMFVHIEQALTGRRFGKDDVCHYSQRKLDNGSWGARVYKHY